MRPAKTRAAFGFGGYQNTKYFGMRSCPAVMNIPEKENIGEKNGNYQKNQETGQKSSSESYRFDG